MKPLLRGGKAEEDDEDDVMTIFRTTGQAYCCKCLRVPCWYALQLKCALKLFGCAKPHVDCCFSGFPEAMRATAQASGWDTNSENKI